jgi:hypothetical protein
MNLRDIFSARVYVGGHVYPPQVMTRMREVALETSRRVNPLGRPWTRKNRDSILTTGAYEPVVQDLLRVLARCYSCGATSITAREVIIPKNSFVPLHAEDAHLSAIYVVDTDARPDLELQDYSGALVLANPGGPFGSRALPWEGPRNDLIIPKIGDLIVFPSYLAHHSFVYNGERPGVEIHFELTVHPLHASPRQSNP